MEINDAYTDPEFVNNLASRLGHVYYSLVMEVGADPEAKAIRAEISGDIDSLISIPKGDIAFFNHRLCEALDPHEKIRLREVMRKALGILSGYEVEIKGETSEGRTVWLINKGEFFKDQSTGRIRQNGFLMTIPGKLLRRNEFASGDDRYHSVAGLMNDYVFSVRCKNGKVIETIHGGACKDVTGYSEEEFFEDENLWFRMVHPSDKELILDRANKMARGETVDELVHRIKHKNGQTRWVKSVIVPHHDEFGNVFLYDGVIRDITEQIQEQQSLEQVSYMNELLLDATPYPMILMQNDGIVLKANRAGYAMGARDEQSCSTMWIKEIDATCEFRTLLDKSMELDSIVVGDISYLGKTYAVTIVPNEPDLLLACLHDVTNSRKLQDRLEEDKMVMQAIFENTIISIMLLDKNGKFEAINTSASRLLDRSQAEIVGLNLYEVFQREIAEKRMGYFQQVSLTRKPIKVEENINGFEVMTMFIPVADKNKEVVKIAVFCKDITQMRKAEANLIETYQVLTSIVENAPLVIIGLDKQRRVILWNDEAENLSAIQSEAAYYKFFGDLYRSVDQHIFAAIERVFLGETIELEKASIELLNGEKYSFHVSFAPKIDAVGTVEGVIIMGRLLV